jgi:outer membrane protein TolC
MRVPCWLLILTLALPAAAQPEEAPALEAPAASALTSTFNTLMERVQPVLDGAMDHTPLPAAESTEEPLVLDLTGCVAAALRDNPRAKMVDENVAMREAQIGQARATKRPQITGQVVGAYVDGLESTVNPPPFIENLIGLEGLQAEKGTMIAQVGVQQVLYAGGRIQASIRASEYLAASESWKRQAELDQIEYDVKQAYYDCLLSLALIEVASESVKTFERHKADAENMLEAGLVSRFELLRAQTELGARETDLQSARTASEVAFLNLRRLLGMEEDRTILLTGNLDWRPLTEPVDVLVTRAQSVRPELRALDEGIAAAKERIQIVRADYRPSVAATVQYQEIVGGPELLPDGLIAMVQGQYDFYTGGRRKFEMLEAEAQVRSLEYQRNDIARLVELDVRQASLRVNEAIEIIRKEQGTVALGDEGLRLSELRFVEGVGTTGDTLNSELAFTQARTSLARALRDYAVAQSALDRALGISLVERTDLPAD